MGGDGMPRVVSHRIVVGGFKLQIMGGTQIETSKVAARSANTQKRSFKAFNCTTTTTFNLRKLIQIQIKVIYDIINFFYECIIIKITIFFSLRCNFKISLYVEDFVRIFFCPNNKCFSPK